MGHWRTRLHLLYDCFMRGVAGPGWSAEIRPAGHRVSDFSFDVLVGASGHKETLEGKTGKCRFTY